MRTPCIPVALLAFVGLAVAITPLEAQRRRPVPVEEHRFELTPFAGYQWGGSYDTDAGGGVPAGQLKLGDSFGWGIILSFLPEPRTAVELIYLRQDTDIRFDRLTTGTGAASTPLGDFANNYIQLGGRWSFPIHDSRFSPFIGASLGINILDPKNPNIGSDTKFAWSLGAGAKYMLPNNRIGLRMDIRWWITPVSSGDYGTWCDFYGCFVVEGTAWVNQGQLTGGLVLAF
jgi:opacity protein-like surface antigen